MLHGINHNMFGKRDPVQYGTITLAEIDARLQALGAELGVQVESFQTNSEGAMCERIHRAFEERCDAVLINAGAWTHTIATAYAMRSLFSSARLWNCTCPTFTLGNCSDITRYSPRSSMGKPAALGLRAICLPCEPQLLRANTSEAIGNLAQNQSRDQHEMALVRGSPAPFV